MLSPEYLAGFFDGEGCISLFYINIRQWKSNPDKRTRGFRFVITVSNTYRPVLDAIQAQFGGDVGKSVEPKETHKQVYAWRLNSTEMQRKFLETIAPHSAVKADAIRLGMEYLRTKGRPGARLAAGAWAERLRLYAAMREINMRGRPKPPAHTPPLIHPEGWNPKNRSYSDIEMAEMMAHARAGKTNRAA